MDQKKKYLFGKNICVLDLDANTPGNTNAHCIDSSMFAGAGAVQANALYQPVLTDNVFGAGIKGYVFDGLNDHFFVQDSDLFTFSDANSDLPFTICSTFVMDSTKRTQNIVCKRDGTTSNIEWQLVLSDGALIFGLYSGNLLSNCIRKSYPFVPVQNQIYKIKCTYDGSSSSVGINMFLNDTSVGVSQNINTYTKMVNSNSKITIGAAGYSPVPSTNYDTNLQGYIQNIKIYKGVV